MAEETFYEESLENGLKFIFWEGHGLMRSQRRSRVKKWFICKALAGVISLLWCGWEWHKVVEINGKEFTLGSPGIVFWSREAVLGMYDDEKQGKAPPWATSGRAACQRRVSSQEGACSANELSGGSAVFYFAHSRPQNLGVGVNVLIVLWMSMLASPHTFMPEGMHAESLIPIIKKGSSTCQPFFHPKMCIKVTWRTSPGNFLYALHIQKGGASQWGTAHIACQK